MEPQTSPKTIGVAQTLWLSFLVVLVLGFIQYSVLVNFAEAQMLKQPDADRTKLLMGLQYDAMVVSLSEIFGGLIAGAMLVLFVFLRGIPVKPYFGLEPFLKRDLFNWFLVVVAITLAFTLMTWLISHEQSDFMLQVWQSCDNVLLLIFAIVIVAPFFEELLFRGFIFTGLRNSTLGTGGAIVMSSALWAIIHQQYGSFELIFVFLLGTVLAISRVASKSLYVPIILHMLNNLFAIVQIAMTAESVAK